MTTLGEVVDLNPPKPSKDALPPDAGVSFIPMPAVDAQSGKISDPERRPFSSVRKRYTAFRDGDVIFAKITPCMENGKAAVARNMINGLGFGSTEFHVLRPRETVLPEYVYYYIRQESFRRAAEAEMTGSVGQKRVPSEFFRNADFPLPPIAEQKRIVAKIEELLPKVNAVRERLIRVKEIMKRFRQSVLSAACSGSLSAGWKEANPNVQTASELLKQVQIEEKRLYATECEKAKRNGKGKPRRPSILELSEIDSHPEIESWVSLRMDYAFRPDGLFDGPFGSNLKTSDYTQSGIRVVRIENIGFLTFLEEKKTYISPEKYETLKKHTVGERDLIFASFISEGVRAVVLPKMEKAIAKADCFCLRPLPKLLDNRYLAMLLSCRQTYSELVGGIHGATRPRITTKQLRSLNIPLAPLEEQKEIVRRVESLFKIADNIENRVAVELSRTEKMTQAILAKAFRGELVPTEAELLHREEQTGSSSLMEQGESYKNGPVIYTIGHSVHSLEKLVSLLNRNRIEVLVDIRSEPYSRKVSHFNKDNLEKEIRRSGLRYLFLGKELGGRPSKSQFYDEKGFVLYSKIAESPDFKTGLERVLKGIDRFRVALMCSEENPANCHRHLLVGRVLSDRKVRILHIRGDGKIQSDDEIPNDPYQAQSGQSQQSLFVSEESSEWKSTQSVLRRKTPSNSSVP